MFMYSPPIEGIEKGQSRTGMGEKNQTNWNLLEY